MRYSWLLTCLVSFAWKTSLHFSEEAAPAFVENDPDASEPKLVVTAAVGAAAQQLFDDSLVAAYKLCGYASLNLLYLVFQAMYLGDLFLEVCFKIGYEGNLGLQGIV